MDGIRQMLRRVTATEIKNGVWNAGEHSQQRDLPRACRTFVGTYGHTSLPGFHKHRTSNEFQYDVTVVGIAISA